ncbi:50S ribosomal protein L5 [Candidatus Pacearchaeota archaeon]|nr:50S ribosomal protein L5 [Candidatus Pacearchaeota archaeon]
MTAENYLKQENPTRKIKIEKVVLSVGGTADKLEKGYKLLAFLSGMIPLRTKSRKRIPSLGVRPGLEVGAKVTLRGVKMTGLLKQLLEANDRRLKESQVSENTLSFGIKEYIEIPEIEYQRDIGIAGFDVTITFARMGKRIIYKKKGSKLPKKQHVSKDEIVNFMKDKFKAEFLE